LIPVSAVGPGFASYRDGIMEVTSGHPLAPSLVDLSIGLTLVDQIRELGKLRDDRNSDSSIALLWGLRQAQWLVAKLLGLKNVADRLNNSIILAKYASLIPFNVSAILKEAEGWLNAANDRMESQATGLEEKIQGMVDTIRDRNSAIDIIVQVQAALVASLEKKYPASNLNAMFASADVMDAAQ